MPETITHVFVDCLYSTKIWDLLKNWIYQETGSAFDLDKKKINITWISGRSTITFVINAITLIVKYYLFKCLKESRKPSFNALQLNIKRVFDEQSYLYAITDASARFTRNWMLVSNLIQTNHKLHQKCIMLFVSKISFTQWLYIFYFLVISRKIKYKYIILV